MTPDSARPVAIEDPSNRALIHPLSAALLAPAVRLGVSPNAVSLAGLGCGILAAFAYAHWRDPTMIGLGFGAMVAWHILDGLDGKLARVTGRTTAMGRVLDGAVDYLVFAMVEMAIVFSYGDWPPVLALCLTAAAAHVVQAATYEGERAAWLRRARGRFAPEPRPVRLAWLTGGHEALERLGNRQRAIDAVLVAQPERLDAVLAATAPRVCSLAVLGANARTATLALACLAGNPTVYWWWTLIGLSGIGVMLVARLRRAEAALSSPPTRC